MTQGSPSGNASIKVKRSMKLLLKVMVVLYKGLTDLEKTHSMGTECKGEITRTPMYRKYLPFT